MNNLEPRAKIGDVVIVSKLINHVHSTAQLRVVYGWYNDNQWKYTSELEQANGYISYSDEQILKNLTTNISYE